MCACFLEIALIETHPAGVSGVGCLALISAFVPPNAPVDAAMLTAIKIA